MTDAKIKHLAEILEQEYKYYRGWHFSHEYPGYLVYHKMGGGQGVYFTPDHDQEGAVSIQVSSDDGETLETDIVPYDTERALAPGELFAIVRPFLDKYDR